MEDYDLLPCPFCGEKPAVCFDSQIDNWRVECGNIYCKAAQVVVIDKYKSNAMMNWDKRK